MMSSGEKLIAYLTERMSIIYDIILLISLPLVLLFLTAHHISTYASIVFSLVSDSSSGLPSIRLAIKLPDIDTIIVTEHEAIG